MDCVTVGGVLSDYSVVVEFVAAGIDESGGSGFVEGGKRVVGEGSERSDFARR